MENAPTPTFPDASPSGMVLDLPNGLRLYLGSGELIADAKFIVREIFHDRAYHHAGFELGPTDTVVDIGAHLGIFALWAAPQLPQGRLVCVEPTSSADSLEQGLALNGLSRVSLHRFALGAPGVLEMIDQPGFAGLNRCSAFQPSAYIRFLIAFHSRKQCRLTPPLRTIPCVSLETLFRNENIDRVDFLKVDCEGAEYAILDHALDDLLRKVRRIAMEFHEFHPTHDPRRLVVRLEKCGFRVEVECPRLHHLLYKTGRIWATRL